MSTRRFIPTVVDATTLKMSLGSIGERVRTEDLQITKHGTPQAMVISVDRYHRLTRLEPVDPSSLEALHQEFDNKLVRMQSAQQGVAMNRLMDADEDDINRFLNQHYDQNPVPQMANPAKAFTAGGGVARSKPFNAMQVLTVPSVKAKKPSQAPFTVVKKNPDHRGAFRSSVVAHAASGKKIVSVASVAAKATQSKKPSK